MVTTVTIATHVAHGYDRYYVRTMLKAARPLLVHTRWGQVKDIPQNSTDVIRFRRYSLLAVATTALTEGTTPAGKTVSVTNIGGTVLQYGDYIEYSDWVSYVSPDPTLTEFADLLGQQAGNTIDQLCRNVMNAGTTVQYAGGVAGTSSVTINDKFTRVEVRKAVRTLQQNDAMKVTSMVDAGTGFNTSPLNAAFIGIIGEETLFDLKTESGWLPVEEYASKADVMEGEVGALDEVRFVSTTNSSTSSTAGVGGITVHQSLILGRDYYGISRISGKALQNINKPLGSSGTADPLNQRATSGWVATFVAIRLNENFCVRVEHAVTA